MLEDKLLIWKYNRGDRDALLGIYQRYKNDLVSLAAALLIDAELAEDVVHDVFVNFIKSLPQFRLTGSLKSFLATCVANNARNRNRAQRRRRSAGLDEADTIEADSGSPLWDAIFGEESSRLTRAIGELPYEQREALLLRSHADLKFKTIAVSQGVSVNTVRGRYRYAVDKLRSILGGKVKK